MNENGKNEFDETGLTDDAGDISDTGSSRRRGISNSTWRTAGRIIKYIAIVFVFSICALVIWRMLSNGDPKSMTCLAVSGATYSAYDAYNKGEAETFTMYYQNQKQLTSSENNAGYFGITYVTVIPEAKQIQVVFRYNNSTLRYITEDLGLASIPGRDEDVFDVTLVLVTDLTPDNKDDNDNVDPEKDPDKVSETRYYASGEVLRDKKNVYNYRKFIFENVEIDDITTLAVFADVYFKGVGASGVPVVPDYSEEPLGTLRIYNLESERQFRTLSSADVAALEDYKKKLGE